MRILSLFLAIPLFAQSIGVVVRDVPEIVTETLPVGVVGVNYSVQLEASGGTAPYEWSYYSGSIGGLNVSPSGVLSGVPTTVVSPITIAFQVKDANGSVRRKILVHSVVF